MPNLQERLLRQLLVPGLVATALTATKPRFITGTLAAVTPVTSTADVVIGVNRGDGQGDSAVAVGEYAEIAFPGCGIVEVELGDTISAVFTELTHDSSGRAVPWTAGTIAHALALATGVVGDVIPVLHLGRSTALADVTATAAELNLLDTTVAGTAVASKALALGANKNVDTLVVADGGLKLGSGAGTAVTATAAELNLMDKSAQTEDITEAGALSVTKTASQIAGGAGFAVTLAAPTAANVGQLKIITLESISSNAVTLALTNVIGGSQATSASFDAAGETLVLVGIEVTPGAFKWLVLKEQGVTLS